MKPTAVVLANASRARFFEVGKHRGQAGVIEPTLIEIRDLIQPGRRLRSAERLTDTRPGSRQATPTGPGHAVDDHRDAKLDDGDRRFAADIVEAISALCNERSISRLVVVAPPRFVGHLRERDIHSACHDVDIVALDLSNLTPPRAFEKLRRSGHLPDD